MDQKNGCRIEGNLHPDFLFDRVPSCRRQLSTQVNDQRGMLQYWHPAYLASGGSRMSARADITNHAGQACQQVAVHAVASNVRTCGHALTVL